MQRRAADHADHLRSMRSATDRGDASRGGGAVSPQSGGGGANPAEVRSCNRAGVKFLRAIDVGHLAGLQKFLACARRIAPQALVDLSRCTEHHTR